MKKLIAILAVVVCVVAIALFGFGSKSTDTKILVAYYSYSGNTELLANEIAAQIGADLYRIETADANWYPTEYKPTTEQAKAEIANGTLPPIKDIVDLSQYEIVFVGTPCWWGTMAVPVKTFLATADLSGKTVIPFSTHGTSSANTHADIVAMTPNSGHLDGLALRGADAADSENAVREWLEKIEK